MVAKMCWCFPKRKPILSEKTSVLSQNVTNKPPAKGGGTFCGVLWYIGGGAVQFGGVYGTIREIQCAMLGVSSTNLGFFNTFRLVFAGCLLGVFLIFSGSEWGVGAQAVSVVQSDLTSLPDPTFMKCCFMRHEI